MAKRLLKHDLGLKYGEMMRVCSSNYESGDEIKKHTLDQIVNRYIDRELFEEAEEMLDIVYAIKEKGI